VQWPPKYALKACFNRVDRLSILNKLLCYVNCAFSADPFRLCLLGALPQAHSECRAFGTEDVSKALTGAQAGTWRWERGLLSNFLLLNFFMPVRIQKPVEPAPWGPKQGDGGGPRSPDISRPDTKDLLKKMRKVDPNQSKRYRQRTGQ
jgi:hypothetical protein